MKNNEFRKLRRRLLLTAFCYHPIRETTRYAKILFAKLPDSKFKSFILDSVTYLSAKLESINKLLLSIENRLKPYFTLPRRAIIAIPFLYYAILLVTNTLKFESTFLILFFLLFVNLLYINIYNYINVELDKYAFNTYLIYKQTVARRIKRLKSNVIFFKVRKNRLKSIVRKLAKVIAVTYVNNFIHFRFFKRFILIFFVHTFITTLINSQFKFKKI